MPDPKIVKFGDFPPHRISQKFIRMGDFLRTLPQAYYIRQKILRCAGKAPNAPTTLNFNVE